MVALTSDETILGLTAIQGCHGYELIEAFQDPAELEAIWEMSTSQINAVLKRLEQQGFITGRVTESDIAPNLSEYHLTSAGQRRLDTWLHDLAPSAPIRRIRVEFLSHLYLARQLNIPTGSIIICHQAACEAERNRLSNSLGQRKCQYGLSLRPVGCSAGLDRTLWIGCRRCGELM